MYHQSSLRPRTTPAAGVTVAQTSPADDDPTVTLLVRQQHPDGYHRNAHLYQHYGQCGHRPLQLRTSADDLAADGKNAPPSYAVIFSPSPASRTSLPNSPAAMSTTSSPRKFFVAAPVLAAHDESSADVSCASCHVQSSTAVLMTSSSAVPDSEYRHQQHQIYYLPPASGKPLQRTTLHQAPPHPGVSRRSASSPTDNGDSETTSGPPVAMLQVKYSPKSRTADPNAELVVPRLEPMDNRDGLQQPRAINDQLDLIGNMATRTGTGNGNNKGHNRVAVVELASLTASRQEMINAL